MKKIPALFQFSTLLVCIGSSVGCMTSYDSYGNQRQSVDPGVAIAGVAAAGLVGYALANDGGGHSSYGVGYSGSYSSGRYYGSDPGYGYGGGYSDPYCY